MQTIIDALEDFMRKNGQQYNQFYVGIAKDPVDRLINGHSVTENIPNLYWTAPLHTEIIRVIEKYFLDKGCKGGSGGGNYDTNYIYTYLITNTTRE